MNAMSVEADAELNLIVDFITKAANDSADTLRSLHSRKKLTPLMTAQWESQISAFSGVAAALRRHEHRVPR